MSQQETGGPAGQPSEAELRAALEEELKRITVDDVLLQTIVSLINLAGRRAGLAPGTEAERDPAQLGTAIEAVQALLPLAERGAAAGELGPIRDALAQLQLAFARGAGTAGAPAPEGEEPPADAGPDAAPPAAGEGGGPAQSSGRLWVPGQ